MKKLFFLFVVIASAMSMSAQDVKMQNDKMQTKVLNKTVDIGNFQLFPGNGQSFFSLSQFHDFLLKFY